MMGSSDSRALTLVDEALRAAEGVASSRHISQLTAVFADPPFHRLTRSLNRLAAMAGVYVARTSYVRPAESFRYDLFSKWTSIGMLRAVLQDAVTFDSTYASLQDDASRTVFDWFVHVRVAYAAMGEEALTLYPAPIAPNDYVKLVSSLGKRTAQGYRVGKWVIDSDPSAIVDSILLEQYRLPGLVENERGDVILDIGAYKGETALWFADQVGPEGLVLAMEPSVQTGAVLRQNVARNRSDSMAPIRILPNAAGADEGVAQFIATADSASTLGVEGETTVAMTTIDAVVVEQHLSRVDFIKMDIEGGEVDALKGAEQTLKRFTPRLAISVYHRPRDLPDIVALVRQACPDYRLYLSHKSPRLAETILFAEWSGSV